MASPLELFAAGTVIPAHPLALTAGRRLNERHQAAYPHLTDDAFVAENRDRWLACP